MPLIHIFSIWWPCAHAYASLRYYYLHYFHIHIFILSSIMREITSAAHCWLGQTMSIVGWRQPGFLGSRIHNRLRPGWIIFPQYAFSMPYRAADNIVRSTIQRLIIQIIYLPCFRHGRDFTAISGWWDAFHIMNILAIDFAISGICPCLCRYVFLYAFGRAAARGFTLLWHAGALDIHMRDFAILALRGPFSLSRRTAQVIHGDNRLLTSPTTQDISTITLIRSL